jgi:hypothetical protein
VSGGGVKTSVSSGRQPHGSSSTLILRVAAGAAAGQWSAYTFKVELGILPCFMARPDGPSDHGAGRPSHEGDA